MVLPLLLVFSVFSLASTATIAQLKWQPEYITKASILANHAKFSDEKLFEGVPTLAFITSWNSRGFLLARKNAKHLTYISNVWFEVRPVYDLEDIVNVVIHGKENINKDFTNALRKSNPDIKIVPRFFFKDFPEDKQVEFVQNEVLVQKSAQTIANYCHRYGFDGAVIDSFTNFYDIYGTNKMETLEMMQQIGNVIRRNRLIAILSLPPPIASIFKKDDKLEQAVGLKKHECDILLDGYDHFQIWTYIDGLRSYREFIHDAFIHANLEACGFSPKMMIGISLYGMEFDLQQVIAARKQDDDTIPQFKDLIVSKRFLEVLKLPDSELTWNAKTKEHELASKKNNILIIFPSLTTLEYRIALAKEHNASVAFWDYGQGLDYFVNLL